MVTTIPCAPSLFFIGERKRDGVNIYIVKALMKWNFAQGSEESVNTNFLQARVVVYEEQSENGEPVYKINQYVSMLAEEDDVYDCSQQKTLGR